MRRKKRPKGTLVYKNHRYYENGRPLRKKDYIYHSSSQETEYILTDLGKYKMDEIIFA